MLYRLYIYRLRGGTNTPFGTGLVAVFTKLGGARDISIITGEDRDIRIFFFLQSTSFLSLSVIFVLRRRSKNLFLHRGTRGDNNYQSNLAIRPVTKIAIVGATRFLCRGVRDCWERYRGPDTPGGYG